MKCLFVLYSYNNHTQYSLSYAFDSQGIVESEGIYASAKEFTNGNVSFLRPPAIQGFKSFEQLKDFVFNICRERSADRVVLLTHEQFNEAIEESSNSEDLMINLTTKGESLENLGLDDNKSLLGKIFG